MSAVTRGKNREVLTFVKVTSGLAYGFKPIDITSYQGIGASDLTALGHKEFDAVDEALIKIVGCNAPKPARYRKRVTRTPSATLPEFVSAFGSTPTKEEAKARALAEWYITKPVRNINFAASTNTNRSVILVPISTGGYYVTHTEKTLANAYADELGLIVSSSGGVGDTIAGKCFSGTSRPKPALVTRREGNGTITMPCRWSKLDEVLKSGNWKPKRSEILADGVNA